MLRSALPLSIFVVMLQNALLLQLLLLIQERLLLFPEDVGDAALPPAFESGSEEALFQKGHLGLYCLDSLHSDRKVFIYGDWRREKKVERKNLSDLNFNYVMTNLFSSTDCSFKSLLICFLIKLSSHVCTAEVTPVRHNIKNK